MPIGGIISGIGSAIGGIANARTSRKNLKDQLKHNREMAMREYTQNIEQRDYMNQYNAPVAQMQRFKEAGLNPHLIYGKGTAGAGQQTSAPKYQEQKADFSKRQSLGGAIAGGTAQGIGNYLDIQKKQNEITAQQQGIRSTTVDLRDKESQNYEDTLLAGHAKKRYEKNTAYYQQEMAQEKERQLRESGVTHMPQLEANLKIAELSALNADQTLTANKLKNAFTEMSNIVYRNTTAKGRTLNENAMISGWTDILEGRTTDNSKLLLYHLGAQGAKILTQIGSARMLGASAGKNIGRPAFQGTTTNRKINYDKIGKRTGSSVTRTTRNN